jgi:PIN domain nuclease of toxin-antitoxin system
MAPPVFLDTCALLWLASDSGKLSISARARIRDASEAFCSPISAWEIAPKVALGDLTLPADPLKWFEALLARYRLEPIPLTVPILVRAAQLPRHHKDPADRFIIATALLNNLPVATADHRFAEYGIETFS